MCVSLPVLLIGSFVAILAGGLLGWLLQRGRISAQQESLAKLVEENQFLQRESGESQKQVARLEERLIAEKAALMKVQDTLQTTFKGLASDVLSSTSKDFLVLAKEQLGAQQVEAKGRLDEKETAIATLLEPVRKTLETLAKETQDLEIKRERAYVGMETLIRGVESGQVDLRKETGHLAQAMRETNTRGDWGQQQLRRCVEFAGMVERCTFDLQVHVDGDEEGDRSVRPDAVIRLPNERCIVVDAKTPWKAFLEAIDAPDPDTRRVKFKEHAKHVKGHIDALRKKKYFDRFEESPDFILCFLPSEALFRAALEGDPELIEYGSRANVILSSPTTLIALLKAVSYGWQQMEITRHATAIRDLGQILYDKLAVMHGHFAKMGNAISSSAEHYNKLVGSVEGSKGVFSLARNLREKGIGQMEITELPQLEMPVRDLKAEAWLPNPQLGFEDENE